jgi:hypothetical protein
MLVGRRRYALIPLVCLGFAELASAQAHSVGGTVSIFAGVPNCNDSDQVVNSQLASATTIAGCIAANGASASGVTTADLAAGSIGVELFASPTSGGYAGGAAQASLTDQLHFTVPGGLPPGEDLLVGVTFTLEGTLSADALFDPIYGRFLDYDLNFYDWAAPFDPEHGLTEFGKLTTAPFTGSLVSSQVVKIDRDFLLANVSMYLTVPGITQGGLEFLDLLDGARIELDLPPGVTFTSLSGVFLTAPEPGATALATASLATLAVVARARSKPSRV